MALHQTGNYLNQLWASSVMPYDSPGLNELTYSRRMPYCHTYLFSYNNTKVIVVAYYFMLLVFERNNFLYIILKTSVEMFGHLL